MTSPPDDTTSQDISIRSQLPPSQPSIKPLRVVQRGLSTDESGVLVSRWGTAIFLILGLTLAAGLVGASYWLITEAEVIAKSNVMGTFQSKSKTNGSPAPGFNPPPNLPSPQNLPPSNPAKPSRQRPSRTDALFIPPGPPPQHKLTKEEQESILDSLHPLEDDDKRSEDIQNGFSIENIVASQKDPEDCHKMTEVIRNTFSTSGQNVALLTDRFYHPTLHQRIREQLPPEILARSKLFFELKYMARVSPQVRVVHVERYNDDTERTAYCHVGDHSEYAFRYELVRIKELRGGEHWYVVDMESIDTGLSLSEVVAMSETLNVLFPMERGKLYTNAINLFHPHEGEDIESRVAKYRKYLTEKVPNPLRDFYMGVTVGAEDKFWGVSPKGIEWVSDVEDLDRFISVHRLRMDFARNEGNLHDVVMHGDRYMAQAGYACPPVVRNYSEALIQLDRVQDSLEPLEYLLTLDRKDETTIQMLAIRTADSEVRKQLAPLLKKYELDSLLSIPESDGKPQTPASPTP